MLKGDLSATTVATVLRELAHGGASGCLHVVDPAGGAAKAYLRDGRVYSVLVPGSRPKLGARLMSSGALGPEALAEALEAQRTELQGWRLGELLVHLGYVDQPVVEAFVNEQVRESLSVLLPWRDGAWKFRVNERTREDVAPPVDLEELLAAVEERASIWAAIATTVRGPDAVPVLSAAGTADAEVALDADAWSLLCKVDGARTVTELARECGFTLYEAGQVVFTLVRAGLLEIDDDETDEPVPSDLLPADVASRLVDAFGEGSPLGRATEPRHLVLPAHDDVVNGSITRVSEALAALLGPATAGDDIFNTPLHRPPVQRAAPEDPKQAERARREALRRSRDADELATAQADLEAARTAEQERRADLLPDDHVADVVDLHAVREAARLEDERAEAERAAAAELAAVEEARLEQERVEAEAAEQARLEQERVEAEAAEQARLEQERLDAEAAEQERLEQERADAEAAEQARLEQERLDAEAAEQARLEQEQVEAEAARVEQERQAAEAAEQARLAAEAAEQQARVEQERLEAEAAEQARLEQERAEAARVEQERLEAEAAEQSRLEQERQAAEAAEQARLAAEAAEQARVEQERLEAEAAEQARLAAEAAEQARLEQERAEAEAARLEQERQAAEAAEHSRLEQERLAAEAAEAARQEQARAEAVAAEQGRIERERAEAEAAQEQRALEEARAAFAEASALEQQRAEQERAEQERVATEAQAAAAAAELAAYAAEQTEADGPDTASDREAQAAAFAELSASASLQVPEPEPAMAASAPAPQQWDDEPRPSFSPHDTDTASLLRELSSLGLDDEPAPAPPTRPTRPPAPRAVAPPPKKKKGLFGRG